MKIGDSAYEATSTTSKRSSNRQFSAQSKRSPSYLPEEKEILSIELKSEGDSIALTIINPLEVLEEQRQQSVSQILNLARGEQSTRLKIEYLHMEVAQALLGFYKGEMNSTEVKSGGVHTTIRFAMKSMEASLQMPSLSEGFESRAARVASKHCATFPKNCEFSSPKTTVPVETY